MTLKDFREKITQTKLRLGTLKDREIRDPHRDGPRPLTYGEQILEIQKTDYEGLASSAIDLLGRALVLLEGAYANAEGDIEDD